jgi:hypothetical protein
LAVIDRNYNQTTTTYKIVVAFLFNPLNLPRMNILNLSAAKLKHIVALKTQIERLQSKLETLAGAVSPAPTKVAAPKKRTMSAAARKKISLAAKARWAKIKGAKSKSPAAAKVSHKKKRTMSAAARQKISLAAKARWAKVRAAKKLK